MVVPPALRIIVLRQSGSRSSLAHRGLASPERAANVPVYPLHLTLLAIVIVVVVITVGLER